MLSILSAIFGPHRAVTIYAFLKTWGLGLAAAVVMAFIVGGLSCWGMTASMSIILS